MFPFDSEQPIKFSPASKASIMESLSLDSYRKAWRTRVKPNVKVSQNGCFLHKYKPNKNEGYCQIAVNNKKYCAHVVSFILWHRTYDANLHVSHRCGQPICCNPEHLVLEARQVNESRKHCIKVGTFTTCIHNPKCIGHSVV